MDISRIHAHYDFPEHESPRDWETSGYVPAYIKFSLKNNVVFWEEHLQPSQFVLNILRYGYILPFQVIPSPICLKNNASSLKHAGFVSHAITELLNAGFVTELTGPAFCCNPLTVADKGKLRLVLDLRHVNKHLTRQTFRYEDLHIVAELFEQNDYFVHFDLTSGYHHIDIHPDYHTYLGFHWDFDGILRYFQFTVLCFGICTACYVFTKVLRPLTKRWRGMGIKTVLYIDDGIGAKADVASARIAGQQMSHDLKRAGFHLNYDKSNFEPTQVGKWLGTIIDTRNMTFYVPPAKLAKLKSEIENLLYQGCCTAKALARVAGTLSSMHLAIGPLVRLFTRSMYQQVAAAASWQSVTPLAAKVVEDLNFWLKNIKHVNGFSFKHHPTTTKIVFTDASQSGYGGFTMSKLGRLICAGKFTIHETQQSSTFRELLAVKKVLQSYDSILSNQAIQINTDNFSASRILTIGSSKEPLQNLALDIFYHCLRNNIKLTPEWTPREQNKCADYFSKIRDTDSWSIDGKTFEFINSRFGPFTVDRFADDRNKKLPIFNSRYYCPGTSHVNSFTADWGRDNNWLVPPISLIGSTIKHLKSCKGTGTLLVPAWESSYFWPYIFPHGTQTADYIKGILVVNPLFESYTEHNVFNGYAPFKTLALKLHF